METLCVKSVHSHSSTQEKLIFSIQHCFSYIPKSSRVSSAVVTRGVPQPYFSWRSHFSSSGKSVSRLSTHLNQVRNHHHEHKVKKQVGQESSPSLGGHCTWTVNKHLRSQSSESKLPLSSVGNSSLQCPWAKVSTAHSCPFYFQR